MNTYYSYSGEYKGEHYKQRLLSSLQLLQLLFFCQCNFSNRLRGELHELQLNFMSQIHKIRDKQINHKESNDIYFFFLFELQSSHVFEKIAQTSISLNKLHNNNWNQDTTKMNFKFF